MQTAPADFVIQIIGVNTKINFNGIKDFERIMLEDKFKLVYTTDSLSIYEPTKERQFGNLSYVYVIREDRTIGNTVYEIG